VRRFFYTAFLLMSATSALADPAQKARDTMVGHCMQDGDSAKFCSCLFDTWEGFIPTERRPDAYAIAHLFSHSAKPTKAERDAVMPFVPAFNQADAQCSNMPDHDVEATLKGISGLNLDGMSEAQRAQMVAITQAAQAGDIAGLMAMQPVSPEPEDPPADIGLDIDYASLAEAEAARLEALGPARLRFAEYEQMFTLRCLADETPAEQCGCWWQAALTADQGQDNAALAYILSLPAGDGLMQHFPSDQIDAAFARFAAYTQAQSACY
jgi:hypothetical protein